MTPAELAYHDRVVAHYDTRAYTAPTPGSQKIAGHAAVVARREREAAGGEFNVLTRDDHRTVAYLDALLDLPALPPRRERRRLFRRTR